MIGTRELKLTISIFLAIIGLISGPTAASARPFGPGYPDHGFGRGLIGLETF